MKKKTKILIIEDDKGLADVIGTILGHLGHMVTISYNAEDGLNGFFLMGYDLVITDIFMEGMGGIQGIRLIRKMDADVPIIAISAGFKDMSPEATLLAAEMTGATSGLAKPFTPESLAEVVTKVLA